jgi:hypothetical protein
VQQPTRGQSHDHTGDAVAGPLDHLRHSQTHLTNSVSREALVDEITDEVS